MKLINLDWKLGYRREKHLPVSEFVAATVPGAVQLDWAKAHGWEDWWKRDNFKAYGWMEDVFWTYRTVPQLPEVDCGTRLELILEGVDYHCVITINQEEVFTQEGMFTPIRLDLTAYAGSRPVIEVVILPAPKAILETGMEERWHANSTCKPPVSYGWDWHPRLIPCGLWKPAYIRVIEENCFTRTDFSYVLADDFSRAELQVMAEVLVEDAAAHLAVRLTDAGGTTVGERTATLNRRAVAVSLTVEQPHLWWCHDLGRQYLYTLEWELRSADGRILDRVRRRCGFRRVRLVMHEGQWMRNASVANTQALPPVTIELNGKQMFGRGSNWVPPEVFPGIITAETYRPLLDLAVKANFNILRCWGGGIVNKDSFFDQCDERGLLVWQEFPLSCMNYEPNPRYLRVLRQEAVSIIHQVKTHPCLALWCGGNELFCYWSKATMQNTAIRLLDALCLEYDSSTPFLPTSPIMGMRHGWYFFRSPDDTQDIFQMSIAGDATAYTEFGNGGASPAAYLRRFMAEEELFPPRWGTSWQTHHGLGAFGPEGMGWLSLPILERYFGKADNLEELTARSEWLQCEGYKAAFEEYRRQKPRSAMAINWDFNEPWPSAAGNNLINWPAEPKPCYYAVQAANRPQMLSARIPQFAWTPEETLSFEVWLLNDRYAEIPSLTVEVLVESAGRSLHAETVSLNGASANRHTKGPLVRIPLREAAAGALFIRLRCRRCPEFDSEYKLLVISAHCN